MKSISNIKFFLIISIICITTNYVLCSETDHKEKQFAPSDLILDYIQLPISSTTIANSGLNSDLEKDVLVFQPYSLKTVNTIFQKVTYIKFEDLIIFENFEVMFDINVHMRNIFGIANSDKNTSLRIALEDMQNKFKHNWKTCRIIFSTDSIRNKLMVGINNEMLSKCSESSPAVSFSSIYLNVFCFETINHTFIFESTFSKNFESFLTSIPLSTVKLYYFIIQPTIYKMMFYLNINNNNSLPFTNSNQNFLTNNMASANNFKYAFFAFSSDGAILSDSPYNQVSSVIFSFTFDSVRDCSIETVNNKVLFGDENISPDANRCCIRMQIMQKDLSITSLILCSYTLREYKCNLEINFIQNLILNKCPCKFIQSLTYAFDNEININEIIISKIIFYT